ncbi:MAG: hypothetical protein EOO73_13440 [Myxococcales bacterium]|nr:MAG: hypothetical protein EOO73_13440 [Myxococcales bacterium]
MLGRSGAGFVLIFGMLALVAACRDRGSADQDSRPLPTPEPPASASPLAPRAEPTNVTKRPGADETKPRPVVPTSAPPASPVPSAAAPEIAIGGSSASSASSAAAPATVPSVPPLALPSAACTSRCQGALQGCLAQPVDGGVPGFANLDLCKKAFEACQAACK